MQQKKTAVQLPVRKIELQWRRARGANEEERELEDYLTEKGDELDLPDATMDCVGDLCTHEPEEFRNIIRLQYRCDELKMQISRISITIIPDKKTGDEANGIEVYDLIDGDWDYIRESVESTSQTIVIHVRLCLLGDGEPLMEWTGNHPANDDEDEEMSSDQGSTGPQTNEFVASVGRIKLTLPSRPKRQDS
jgi:hypothetical protein